MSSASARAAPRRNRVDPWGDLHAVAARGALTGNRGCLVDDAGRIVRHHRGARWIACLTSFRGRRVGLDRPGRWTPVFFLDDAVALAAGHRPCGECRRRDHLAYRDAIAADAALGSGRPLTADELDRRLGRERLRPGRGLERRGDRRLWAAGSWDELPDGAMVVVDGRPHLLVASALRPFGFTGWGPARPLPDGPATVLTPPTSVAALRAGFRPVLDPSAHADGGPADVP